MIYALDTCVIINYLNGNSETREQIYRIIKNKMSIVLMSIVDYEIMRGFYYTPNEIKQSIYKKMRLKLKCVEINSKIWDEAAKMWAELRKKGHTIGDADILIATFCIVNGYTLVTNNSKHFLEIKELKVENW